MKMDNNKVETLKKVLDLEIYIKETKRTNAKTEQKTKMYCGTY